MGIGHGIVGALQGASSAIKLIELLRQGAAERKFRERSTQIAEDRNRIDRETLDSLNDERTHGRMMDTAKYYGEGGIYGPSPEAFVTLLQAPQGVPQLPATPGGPLGMGVKAALEQAHKERVEQFGTSSTAARARAQQTQIAQPVEGFEGFRAEPQHMFNPNTGRGANEELDRLATLIDDTRNEATFVRGNIPDAYRKIPADIMARTPMLRQYVVHAQKAQQLEDEAGFLRSIYRRMAGFDYPDPDQMGTGPGAGAGTPPPAPAAPAAPMGAPQSSMQVDTSGAPMVVDNDPNNPKPGEDLRAYIRRAIRAGLSQQDAKRRYAARGGP